MARIYRRIPGVRRLEYLIGFLQSAVDDHIDLELARKSVQRELNRLELEKAQALGRQKPRHHKGDETAKECLKMATQLQLIDKHFHLTSAGHEVLDPNRQRLALLERLWAIYPRFGQVVLAIRDAETLDLPLYDWSTVSSDSETALRGFGLNRWNFEVIRDLATQLGLINWLPLGAQRQQVYSVSQIITRTELFCLSGVSPSDISPPQERLLRLGQQAGVVDDHFRFIAHRPAAKPPVETIIAGPEEVYIERHQVSVSAFEQALWNSYLELSEMRAYFPVLYPSLRNAVCLNLRVSDQEFDGHLVALLHAPRQLLIYPSGGVLSYAANLAHLMKFLPPRTSQGNFIVYLKIGRKSS